jgi:hypothetical protein
MELKLQRVTPKVTHQAFQASKRGSQKDPGKPGNLENDTCPKMSPCSLSPDVVRYEAEGHRADFNFKMKRALFQSFICAYYVGFIPMRFSKVSLCNKRLFHLIFSHLANQIFLSMLFNFLPLFSVFMFIMTYGGHVNMFCLCGLALSYCS